MNIEFILFLVLVLINILFVPILFLVAIYEWEKAHKKHIGIRLEKEECELNYYKKLNEMNSQLMKVDLDTKIALHKLKMEEIR